MSELFPEEEEIRCLQCERLQIGMCSDIAAGKFYKCYKKLFCGNFFYLL